MANFSQLFPYYHIWDADCKSSPENTDLNSSNKDHNIKSVFNMEAANNKEDRSEEMIIMSISAWWMFDGLLTEWIRLGSKC